MKLCSFGCSKDTTSLNMTEPWILWNRLITAIENEDISTVEEIIDNGFDIDILLMEGKSAISISIERSSLDMAQLLISKGCSLSLKSNIGDYPLHLAVKRADIDLVNLLLQNRADVTSLDSQGKTALHIAIEMNTLDIAELLIKWTPFSHLDVGDYEGSTPLMYACRYSPPSLVKSLLCKGCSVNVINRSGNGLLIECLTNPKYSLEVAQLILEMGAPVNQENPFSKDTPLLKALMYFNNFFTENDKKNQLLKIIGLLINNGSAVNVTNSLHQTPLHLAVASNNIHLAHIILNSGCHIDVPDEMGHVPLYYACRKGNYNMVDLLIESGASLKAFNWTSAKLFLRWRTSLDALDFIIERSRQVPHLSALCRVVVRKMFTKSIDNNARLLPLPTKLIEFIKLGHLCDMC